MQKLSNINTIKDIMHRHNMSFSKSLGQNFLINPSVCPRMADSAVQNRDMCVLEIGPGIGVLTCELAKRAKKVVAVELDKRLIPILNETLNDCDNVKIINYDILKIDLNALFKREFADKQVCVCANLPYYISSAIIMRLLEEHLPIASITVMLQKEMAQRLCAIPGSRDVGAISLAVRYYSEPKILFNVSKGSFMPAPRIDSSVVQLTIKEGNDSAVNLLSEKTFFRLVKTAFSQRRKTLTNTVSVGFNIPKNDITDILLLCGISPKARAEELNIEQFAQLSNALEEKYNGRKIHKK